MIVADQSCAGGATAKWAGLCSLAPPRTLRAQPMKPDIKPTREALWRAVEEFGSIWHLAVAMRISRDELQSWLTGASEIPLEKYALMLEIVASLKAPRH